MKKEKHIGFWLLLGALGFLLIVGVLMLAGALEIGTDAIRLPAHSQI